MCLQYKSLENTGGKGEIARKEQFLLFPQCFQKACFPGTSKGVIVWEWVKECRYMEDNSSVVLKGSFCGCPMSVVRYQHLACGHSRGHIYSGPMDQKSGQNVCPDEILNEFEFGSSWFMN